MKAFNETLQPLESHYCREKECNRQYLSITKIWEAYNDTTTQNLTVKFKYFRSIFTREYNITFKSPAIDVCSTFLQLKCSRVSANSTYDWTTSPQVESTTFFWKPPEKTWWCNKILSIAKRNFRYRNCPIKVITILAKCTNIMWLFVKALLKPNRLLKTHLFILGVNQMIIEGWIKSYLLCIIA